MTFCKQYWKPIIWTIIILILCLLPKNVEPQPSWLTKIPHFDKIVHFGLYAILGFLWYLSHQKKQTTTFFLLIVFYAFILGGSIEIIQPFVGRSYELADLVVDILGCVGGICVYWGIMNNRNRTSLL